MSRIVHAGFARMAANVVLAEANGSSTRAQPQIYPVSYVSECNSEHLIFPYQEALQRLIEFIQLQVNLSDGEVLRTPGSGLLLLGYDLMSSTQTSALLACGPWTRVLASFTQRLNQYGLLTATNAAAAQQLLPIAWPNSLDADADMVALFEVTFHEQLEKETVSFCAISDRI